MKRLCMLLLVALTALPLAWTTLGISQVKQELMIDKSFDAPEDGRLEVHVGDADVALLSGPGDEVHVAVTLYGQNMDRAREYFEKQQFSVTHSGGLIRVASYGKELLRLEPEGTAASWIHVRVTTPKKFDANVRTRDGDIEVGNLKGDLRLRTADGDITADELAGPYLSLLSLDGDIVSSRLNAEIIDIHTLVGDLDLDEIATGKMTARTLDGDIEIGNLTGDLRLKTSDGDITADEIAGPYLSLHTLDGDIVSSRLNAEIIDIHTSDGDLDFDEIATGKMTARTLDGDIELGNLTGDLRFKTSAGGIKVDELAGPYLSLHTLDGYIISSRLFAEIIDIHTSDGDLYLDEVATRKVVARTQDGDIHIVQLHGDGELRTDYGDIHVSTLVGTVSSAHASDGTIMLTNVEGDLSVTGSDTDVELHLQAPGNVVVATSSGDIELTIPQDHPADLVLRGDDVHMDSYINFDGRVDDDYAEGRINGGGNLIKVRTSDGDVVLQTK